MTKRSFVRASIALGILVLMLILAYIPSPGAAALVWSDNFDDLNIDDWTSISCTVEDGTLRGIDPPPPPDHVPASLAYRPSEVAYGTWKFDITEVGEWGEELDIFRIYLITTEPELINWSYYALKITHASNLEGQRLSYKLEKVFQDGVHVNLDTHLGETQPLTTKGTFMKFAITRTTAGHFLVYMNGTVIMDAVDNEIKTSEFFGFYAWRDFALDNVEVYDTIEVGLPLTLIVSVSAVIIIVVVVIIFLKRRGRA
ncbi:MAG: hypothetical protein ACFE7R_07520 [Candidatus Hodarchaeota archaeon]